MPSTHGDAPAVVDLSLQTVLVAIGTICVLGLGLRVISAAPVTTQLVVLGVLFSLALDPVVERLERPLRGRRGLAVAVLCGLIVAGIVALIVLFGPATVSQAQSFQEDLPQVLDQLTSIPLIGPILADNDVPAKIQEWLSNLPKELGGNTEVVTDAAGAVTSAVIVVLAMVLVLLAFLIEGPLLVGRVQRALPDAVTARVTRLGRITKDVVGRYFAGSLVLAILQGLQVLVTGLILNVPLTPLLALWAGMWNLVPQIGGAIGGISFVAVAFTVSPTVGVVAGVIYVVYLLFANNVLLPVIIGRSVDISPFTTMVAAITGFAVGGIIGAILAAPIAGAAKAMYFELRPDAPRAATADGGTAVESDETPAAP
ncbi:MAG: AI-2E family transporter [Acidimicrobiales bacterium]|nr:AI-2E family transporter [Acidimicrobiales bacterium]